MKSQIVTVFGSSALEPGHPDYQTAYQLGRAVAQEGWILCNGGYGGSMEAAAKGAMEVGGHTIGVTCRGLRRRRGPNPYIKQEVPTFNLLTRLETLVRLGNAYVVLPGGTGTLLELALVWELLNKGLLRPGAPLILLGEFWMPLDALIRRQQPDAVQPVVADGPAQAVALVRAAWQTRHASTGAAQPDG